MPIKNGLTLANVVTLFGILIWLCSLYVRLFVDVELDLPLVIKVLLGTASAAAAISCFLPWWHKQFLTVNKFHSIESDVVEAVITLLPVIFGCNAILFHKPELSAYELFCTALVFVLVILSANILRSRFRFALNSN